MASMDSLPFLVIVVIPCVFLCILILICKNMLCETKMDERNDSTTVLHPPPIRFPLASIGTEAPNVGFYNAAAQNVADSPNSSNWSGRPDGTSQYARFSFSTLMENESLRALSDARTGSLLLSYSISEHQTPNYPQELYVTASTSSSTMQYPGVRSSDAEDKPPIYSDVIKQDLGGNHFPEVCTNLPETPPPNYKERDFGR